MASMSPAGSTDLGFPADLDFMFSDHKGRHKPGKEKRQRKLAGSAPFLGKVLEPGEKVLLFCTGCSPFGVLEQLLTGVIIVYVKRALLVFTDRRVFHVPTTQSYGYRNSIAQFRYADCKSMRLSWRTLKVEYRNGRKEQFNYVSSGERSKLKLLIGKLSFEGAPSVERERTHICPRCAHALRKDEYSCAGCHLEFKSPREGAKLSWLVPGGGYFYTGHPVLGAIDALVEIYLIFLLADGIMGVVNGVPESLAVVVVIGVILIIEKLVSVYHSNHFLKEYIPKEKLLRAIAGAQSG